MIVTLSSTTTNGSAGKPSQGASSGPTLDGGTIAGIVIGIVSAIAGILGTYFGWDAVREFVRSNRHNAPNTARNGELIEL